MTHKTNIKSLKCEKLLNTSIESLFNAQEEFDISEFSLKTLEILMYLERKQYLEELKETSNDNKPDIGNGSYPRNFSCLSDKSLLISVPRTRSGSFSPILLTLLDKSKEAINRLALGLYRKGLSSRDISSVLQEFYGENISYSTISNMAKEFHALRKSWESTKLQKHYKVIYLDCLYQTLRRDDSYSKEAIHVVFGVRDDNYRELLYLNVNPTESSNSWEEVLLYLKEKRAIESIDLAVADGINGLEDKLFKIFPGSKLQKCVTHKKRNILLKTRPKDKREMADDLKEVFDNFDKDSSLTKAMEKVKKFKEKWVKKYPNLRFFQKSTMEYYFTYVSYPAAVRKFIYTSNAIENLNKQIRKATKHKISFENEDRLIDYVFVVIKDFEKNNWKKYPATCFSNWAKSQA
jgi:putative transposase